MQTEDQRTIYIGQRDICEVKINVTNFLSYLPVCHLILDVAIYSICTVSLPQVICMNVCMNVFPDVIMCAHVLLLPQENDRDPNNNKYLEVASISALAQMLPIVLCLDTAKLVYMSFRVILCRAEYVCQEMCECFLVLVQCLLFRPTVLRVFVQ